MSDYISVDDALQSILPQIPEAASQRTQLGNCRARHLARPVNAPWSSPRFDNSAMDGYALRYADVEDVPATLEIAGEASAGNPADEVLSEGQAIRISTGAALPSGADTVIRQERCRTGDDGTVTVEKLPSSGRGANIRRAGVYLDADQPALEVGTRLGGAEIGLLASFGQSVVTTFAPPRVAIISTGDELVELDDDPGPGQIVNSNSYMLEALSEEFGATPRVYPTAPDDRRAIEETYRRAIAECDMVLSSGGVSVGDHDHVGAVLDELSDGMSFWKVRMKPGKPLAFGVAHADEKPVPLIGLPGNPASSFVGFHLFVRPALAVAQGVDAADAPLARIDATLRGTARGSSGRRAFLAGSARPTGDGLLFEPRAHQSSGNPALFAAANALGIVDRGIDALDDGATIPVHVL